MHVILKEAIQIGQLDFHKVTAFKALYKRSDNQLLSLGILNKAFYKQNSIGNAIFYRITQSTVKICQ